MGEQTGTKGDRRVVPTADTSFLLTQMHMLLHATAQQIHKTSRIKSYSAPLLDSLIYDKCLLASSAAGCTGAAEHTCSAPPMMGYAALLPHP
jgi:hypothetical protein